MTYENLDTELLNELLGDGRASLRSLAEVGTIYLSRFEKQVHTLKMRIDRFHNSWEGSRASAREWIEQFVHYYNHQRPHQSLDGRTPAEENLN
jgi:transposase InsO family protein